MVSRLRRRSTIGLDYGTHSTKVVHRVQGESLGRILAFDRHCEKYPINAAPSVIREVDGLLYFGTLAVELGGGVNYGSLKADLLKSSGDADIDEEIDVLAATYIAWALGDIFRLDSALAADNPIVQVSAPTSHQGDPNLNERYLRIVHAAYVFVHEHQRVEQGVEFRWIKDEMRSNLARIVPERGDRRFFIAPETVAPIVSLQLEPLIEPGIFLIADMGAATTEMSICAVNDESFGNSILAYADSTDAQGGDDLGEIENLIVGKSQRKLEQFLERMGLQARRVWCQGFDKDKANFAARKRWNNLQVLLTGGGTHHRDVRRHFEEKLRPILGWNEKDNKQSVDRHFPSTLSCAAGAEQTDFSLFAVANGLSVQRVQWPTFFHSEEISRLTPLANTEEDRIPSYLEIG
jgi:hypothetical protein